MTTTGLLGALVLLVVVGVLAERLATLMNRPSRKVERHARQVVSERLSRREMMSVADLVSGLAVHTGARPAVTVALERLAGAIGISPGRLRADDVVRDIVRVRRTELPQRLQLEWAKTDLGEFLDVRIYEVLHALEQTVGRGEWSRALQRVPEGKRPRSEEEWIELILPLTLREVVVLFFDGFGPPERGPETQTASPPGS